jgi:hypothetical protein
MKTANLKWSCKEAELYYYDLLGGEGVGSVPAGAEEHVKGCARCQGEMGRLKDSLSECGVGASAGVVGLLKLHLAYVGKRVSCATVRPFLPTLCDPALEIRVPTPITVHLQRCRRCCEAVEKIRGLNLDGAQLRRLCELFVGRQSEDETALSEGLQEVVQDIVGRAEPEIVTIYHAEEAGKAESGADDAYAGYPVRVEVVEAKGAVRRIDFGEALKRRVAAMNLRGFGRVAAAAAAVILVGAVLLLHTPAAKALTIGEIYDAIAKIKNVYVVKFAAGKEEPVLERWVSRTSRIYMTKAGGELVLWDIGNGVRKSKAATGRTETTRLSDDVIADMEGKIEGSLGLVPFYDASVVPAGAEWVHVSEGERASAAAGREVYDLKWASGLADEMVVSKKWRFFVEESTGIPDRIEVYAQIPGEEGYTLETVMTVEYLSEGEMEEAVRGSSF